MNKKIFTLPRIFAAACLFILTQLHINANARPAPAQPTYVVVSVASINNLLAKGATAIKVYNALSGTSSCHIVAPANDAFTTLNLSTYLVDASGECPQICDITQVSRIAPANIPNVLAASNVNAYIKTGGQSNNCVKIPGNILSKFTGCTYIKIEYRDSGAVLTGLNSSGSVTVAPVTLEASLSCQANF